MKILVLLLNVAFLWFTAEPAYAPPIVGAVTAIAGLIKAGGLVALLLKTVIGLALNFGVSLLQKALMKKQKQAPVGVSLEIKMGDDHPISIVVGKYASAGYRKYAGTWGKAGGTPNAFFTDVIELGFIPNRAGPHGLASVWVSDKLCDILWDQPHEDGRGYPVKQFRNEGGTDFLWIKFLDGTQTQADPFLMAKFGQNGEHKWMTTMIGRNCPAVIITARYSTDYFSSGIPTGIYEPQPTRFYDLRKDSTNGGNGAHRWDNPLTWEPTVNPVVIIYNIIRGIYCDDEWIYGGQNLAAFRLPPSNWMAAANECDVAIDIGDGKTEPQFRAGFEIRGDVEPLRVIDDLRQACNGRIAEVGGVFKILVGAPGAAVYSFSDDDIIVTQGQSLEPFPSLDDLFNGIEATYPEPAEKWATKDAPARYSDDLEAEDGDRRLASGVDFPSVPFGGQVQRLMRAMIEEERRFRIHSFQLPPDAYALEPNDVVSWSSARNGYENKKFVVTRIEGAPTFNQLVILKEIDPADYDWSQSYQLPTAVGWVGRVTPDPQPMTGWSVEADSVTDAAGANRRPAIKISCAPDLEDIVRIWVQVRVKASGALVFDSDQTPYGPPYSWTLSGNWLLPNTEYEVRGKYVPGSIRPTEFSAWLSVKTPNLLISSGDIFDNAIIQSKISDAAITAEKLRDEAVTALKIADAAVTTTKIALQAITAELVANNAIISDKLADGAVEARNLRDQAITETKFAAGLKPVKVIEAAPVDGEGEEGDTVNYNGTLYTYHDGTWSSPSFDLVDGSVTANKLADAAVTAAKLAALAVTNDKIAANAIFGEVIAAGAITARHLTLVDWENLVPDNRMQDAKSWPILVGVINPQSQAGVDSSGAFEFTAAGGAGYQLVLQSKPFPIVVSQAYRVGIQYVKTAGTTVALWARVHWIDATGAIVEASWVDLLNIVGGSTAGGVQKFGVDITAPASNVVAAIIRVYVQRSINDASFSLGGFSWLRKQGANLIVDGAITAAKIAANTITAAQISAGAIGVDQLAANAVTTGKIAAGAITTDLLAVGSSGNFLKNSDFKIGMLYWGNEWTNGGSWYVGLQNDNYAIGAPVYVIRKQTPFGGGTGQQQVYGICQKDGYGNNVQYPCVAGKWYEISCYYYGHRCAGLQLFIAFTDKDGNYLAAPVAIFDANINGNPDYKLSNYRRAWAKFQAPAGAVRAMPFWRHADTVNIAGYNDSYLWLTNLYFGEANANQSQPSPWSGEGSTYIHGGEVVTRSITADRIVAGAITATEIAGNTITGNKIAAQTITGVNIQGATITGDKIAANTISSALIASDAITARNLVLTDWSNIVDNGWQRGTLDGWALQWYQNFYLDTTSGDAAGWVYQSIGRDTAWSNDIAVTAGEVFYFEVWCFNTDPNVAQILCVTYDQAGNASYYTVAQNNVKNAWQRMQGRFSIPPGAVRMQMLLQVNKAGGQGGSVYWSKPICRRAANAEMIVDGAITAAKIAANSITADKLQVASLDAISANLGSVNISSAIIGSLQVGTSNIGSNAITEIGFSVGGWGNPGTAINNVQLSVSNPNGSPVLLIASFSAIATQNNSGASGYRVMRNGGEIRKFGGVFPDTGHGGGDIYGASTYTLIDFPGAGTISYSLENYVNRDIAKIDVPTLVAIVLKR